MLKIGFLVDIQQCFSAEYYWCNLIFLQRLKKSDFYPVLNWVANSINDCAHLPVKNRIKVFIFHLKGNIMRR